MKDATDEGVINIPVEGGNLSMTVFSVESTNDYDDTKAYAAYVNHIKHLFNKAICEATGWELSKWLAHSDKVTYGAYLHNSITYMNAMDKITGDVLEWIAGYYVRWKLKPGEGVMFVISAHAEDQDD